MVETTVLLDTYPGQTDLVLRELDDLPEVTAKTRVHDGVIDIALRVRAPSHEHVAHFVATTLRFLSGVRTVEEVQDADEYNGEIRQAIRALQFPNPQG